MSAESSNTVAMTQSEQVLDGSSRSTATTLAGKLGVGEQTARNNLKKLEELEIIERLSEKQRDKMALYRFKSK